MAVYLPADLVAVGQARVYGVDLLARGTAANGAGAKPAGLSRFDPGSVVGLTVHHPGSTQANFDALYGNGTLADGDKALMHLNLAEALRRGDHDVDYNLFLGRLGKVQEGRGLDYMNAANGVTSPGVRDWVRWGSKPIYTNPYYVSVQVATAPGYPLTPAQVDGFRNLYRWVADHFHRPVQTFELIGHRDVRSTSCPGDDNYKRLGELHPVMALPPFNPAAQQWSLYPIVPKATISVMTPDSPPVRDLVRYLSGVLMAYGYITSYGLADLPVATGLWTVPLVGAVHSFQNSNRLTSDAIVGPSTWRAIDQAATARSAP